jgi:D-beta-D-heptose 7-phosphate kinase / D-beta-D-heptose 1-phosphate adenosyltransferase
MQTSEQKLNRSFHEPEKVLRAVESGFGSRKVVVVGDLMLDRHVWGSVNRISPEAPVPVVSFLRQTAMPGGCGNVAMNLIGLGMIVTVVAVVGRDEAADQLRAELEKAGVGVAGLKVDPSRPTTTKMRVIGGHQQMLRLDSESTAPIDKELVEAMLASLETELADASAVILSDYAKGVLTSELCQGVIAKARSKRIPVLVDPKGKNWDKYRGASLVTPNRSELAVVSSGSISSIEALVAESRAIRASLDLGALTVTLSGEGMIHIDDKGSFKVPAMAREVFDVSGAGDTAISTLTGAIVSGLNEMDALVLANVASGIVVGKVGTAPLAKAELLSELESSQGHGLRDKQVDLPTASRMVANWREQGEQVVFTNGCFDILHAGHVSYLAKAKAMGDRLVLGLNSDDSVRRLKGPTRPINSESDRGQVLAGLESIDAIVVFDEDTPLELINSLKPSILVKGADYEVEDVVGAKEVQSWGGEVRLVEFLEGRSTTRIAEKTATGAC